MPFVAGDVVKANETYYLVIGRSRNDSVKEVAGYDTPALRLDTKIVTWLDTSGSNFTLVGHIAKLVEDFKFLCEEP